MPDECPICHTPYGKRKRCYRCQPGRSRTGEDRTCPQCGRTFHAPQWKLNDTARRQGTYCSNECRWASMRGKPNWRRDAERKLVHKAGYLLVWAPDHPRAHNGRVFEHILVMEAKLGRALRPEEFVHHKDENKQNNHPDNLEIKDNPEHARWHMRNDPARQRKPRVTLQCAQCGREYQVPQHKVNPKNPREQSKYCSRSCRSRAVSLRRWAKEKGTAPP
jgi:hypothetical protein